MTNLQQNELIQYTNLLIFTFLVLCHGASVSAVQLPVVTFEFKLGLLAKPNSLSSFNHFGLPFTTVFYCATVRIRVTDRMFILTRPSSFHSCRNIVVLLID